MLKNIILTLLLVFIVNGLKAQAVLVKDLGQDGIRDSVSYNKSNGVIAVKLSSRDFVIIQSQPVSHEITEWAGSQSIKATKHGFCVVIEYLGASMMTLNNHYFRYKKGSQRVRLVKMASSVGGSGNGVEASVNLLSGQFRADWNLYGYNRRDNQYYRTYLPTVHAKMDFPKIYLKDYNGSAFGKFEDEINKSFEMAQKRGKKKFRTN